MANFVQHEPCPGCGSSDGLARYDDNSAHCFACKEYNEKGDGQRVERTYDDNENKDWTRVEGHYQALPAIGLDEATCRHWKYAVGELEDGTKCHIMESRDDNGKLIAQKFRTRETKGKWRGNAKNPPLYGKWLWPAGGKYLTITEGEKDALSLSKAFGNKFAVTSLPNGTGSVKQVIKRDYEYIDSFENIVLMFDMDEPGRAAVEEALELLPAGKVKIAKLPLKDANEVLNEIGAGELVKAFWAAETYRPDGIVDGSEITLEDILTSSTPGLNISWLPSTSEKLLGIRKAELTLLTAGSGIGKSTVARQLAYSLHQEHNCRIGNVFLEEQHIKTAQAYVALDNKVPLGRFRYNTKLIPPEKAEASLKKIVHQRMKFYDHFGSLESDRLLSKLRHMAQVEKCDFIILDHISIVTSGMESSSEGERKDIDILMTRLAQLVQETGVGIIAIVHLKRTKDKSPNEGDQISLSDLRGSGSLEQLSFNVIALERDQQADDGSKDQMLVRILKCRETGDTGTADTVTYNRNTGWLDLASPFDAVSPFDPHKDPQGDGDEGLPF
jgi:twinkle protein